MADQLSKNPDRIRGMFNNVADRYDRLNRLLSLGMDHGWRSRMIDKVEGDILLDIACGSGDVLKQADGDFATGCGLDFSGSMLDEANRKLNSPSTNLCQGDALNLPFADSTVGAATCAFGVRNFADRKTAFHEIKRVLKPSGNFVILEFFPPSDRWMNKPLRWYMGTVLPLMGRLISGSEDAYEYLNRSIRNFVSTDELQEELWASGFGGSSVESIFFGLVKVITARVEGDLNHA